MVEVHHRLPESPTRFSQKLPNLGQRLFLNHGHDPPAAVFLLPPHSTGEARFREIDVKLLHLSLPPSPGLSIEGISILIEEGKEEGYLDPVWRFRHRFCSILPPAGSIASSFENVNTFSMVGQARLQNRLLSRRRQAREFSG